MEHLAFEKNLSDIAARHPKIISFPESGDERVIKAAMNLLQGGLVSAVLLSDPGTEQTRADLKNRFSKGDADKISFIQDHFQGLRGSLQDHVTNSFQAKGRVISKVDMEKKLSDPLWQSGWLLRQGICDSVLAGIETTTSDVIRAALGTVGLAERCRTVSGSFFMSRQESVMLFADCGVVIKPDAQQLADIASQSVCTWRKLVGDQVDPVVGFLSFSSKGSASHFEASKMSEACRMFQSAHPDILADGELQFDAAYLKDVGEKKLPGSQIPGKTNIFIFPDLNSGNIGYKIAQRLGGFCAYGPILQGTSKVYSDLSRGASVDDIVVSSLINNLRS